MPIRSACEPALRGMQRDTYAAASPFREVVAVTTLELEAVTNIAPGAVKADAHAFTDGLRANSTFHAMEIKDLDSLSGRSPKTPGVAWPSSGSRLRPSSGTTTDSDQNLKQSSPHLDITRTTRQQHIDHIDTNRSEMSDFTTDPERMTEESDATLPQTKHKFKHPILEIGFAAVLCMTQFLSEFLISGFALQLPALSKKYSNNSTSAVWPASLLSLIMSAMLLIFARLSDMFGGYYPFMSGIAWLAIWTLIPGLDDNLIVLEISRAMQGLALATFMPSTFAILGKVYPPGHEKNLLIGIYAAFAPLGFFGGFMVAGSLPEAKSKLYFISGAVISGLTAIIAYITIPRKKTSERDHAVHMDWCGLFFITTGLILVIYALAAYPYYSTTPGKDGFTSPEILAPFLVGIACLGVAFWVEGWKAEYPLLPFQFFKPPRVKAFSLACLCFYACFGVWLFFSVDFFQNRVTTTHHLDRNKVLLGLWYAPLAAEGLLLCAVSPFILAHVDKWILMIIVSLTWIGAPTLLAVAPLPLGYWSFVFPSMLFATAGLNLTFTISIIYLSKMHDPDYQGLCGAVCSMFLGVAFAFSLPIAQIIMTKASGTNWIMSAPTDAAAYNEDKTAAMLMGFRSAFWYAAASAATGFLITVSFMRFVKKQDGAKSADQPDMELAMRPRVLERARPSFTACVGRRNDEERRSSSEQSQDLPWTEEDRGSGS